MIKNDNKIKIFFNYKHTDKPWGGANNFNRILFNKLKEKEKFEIVDDVSSDTDIIFLNSLSKGPVNRSKQIKYLEFKKFKSLNAKIIVRAVNLQQHGHKHNIRSAWRDFWSVKILNEADFVIFQSDYQRNFFLGAGFDNSNNIVIHNGADDNLFIYKKRSNANSVLKLVSTVVSARPTKNLKLLADVSLIDNIEIYHIGAWDEKIDSKKIKLLGKKTHSEMIDLYNDFDAFIHLAIKDPCPNAIFEAILSGLPVLYYPNQTSSSEIVKENGVALDLNNYELSFKSLKNNYNRIVDSIETTRNYYSIDRALIEYIRIFEKVLNSNQ